MMWVPVSVQTKPDCENCIKQKLQGTQGRRNGSDLWPFQGVWQKVQCQRTSSFMVLYLFEMKLGKEVGNQPGQG